MDRLIGADRNAVLDILQDIVGRSGKGLFDQLNAGFGRASHEPFQRFGAPSLVGIEDEPRIGQSLAHGSNTLLVAVSTELELEQGCICFARLRCHRLGQSKRKRKGRHERTDEGYTRQHSSSVSRAFRLEVP